MSARVGSFANNQTNAQAENKPQYTLIVFIIPI
jgi:hypothetical protein